MKTKLVEFYVDLVPGWQNNAKPYLYAETDPMNIQHGGRMRVKMIAELPEIPETTYDQAVKTTVEAIP